MYKSKECGPNYLRNQKDKKGNAPSSARVLPQKEGNANQRATQNKNVKI